MSKSEGKKITIKFTEDLVGDIPLPSYSSYKFYRWNILSGWGNYLHLYEIEMYYKGIKIPISEILNIQASSQYSSYAPTRAFDDSISLYWYTRTIPSWIQIELNEAKPIDEFRWYTATSSYKPKDFIFQGSNDGIAWVGIYEDVSPQDNYWIDFSIIANLGEQTAFSILGKEYKYVRGPLLDIEYKAESVQTHPTVERAILLTFPVRGEFNNAEGNLAIEYDASKGSLSGRGGAVESFTREFLPTELVATPNPNAEENISVAPFEIVAELKDVEYPKGYGEQGNISVAPFEVTATLINVEDINP